MPNTARSSIDDIEERKSEKKCTNNYEESRIKALEEETKRLNKKLSKELTEKDNIILSHVERENKMRQEYQEILANKNKEFMEKILEATKNLQSNHVNQINSVIEKLTKRIDQISIEVQEQTITNKPHSNLPEETKVENNNLSVSYEAYSKLKETLDSNEEYKKIIDTINYLKCEYKERINQLKNYEMTAEDLEERKCELDEWYQEEMNIMNSKRKKLLVDSLKQTANIIEGYPINNINEFDINNDYQEKIDIDENIKAKRSQNIIVEEPYEVLSINKDIASRKTNSNFINNNIDQNVVSITIEKSEQSDKINEELKIELSHEPMTKKKTYEEKMPIRNFTNKNPSPTNKISNKLDQDLHNTPEELFNDIKDKFDESKDKELIRKNTISKQIYNELLLSVFDPLFPRRDIKKIPSYGIHTESWVVEGYIDEIFDEVLKDPDNFVNSLSTSLSRDPLVVLGQIQSEENDYFETIEEFVSQPVLPIELYLAIERSRKIVALNGELVNSKQEAELNEWSNIHNKSIFDAINDALDCYRPYGIKGPPLPWSLEVRDLTYRNGSVSMAEEVIYSAKIKVMNWALVNAGILKLPREEAERYNDLIGEESKHRLNQLREERLECTLK